MAEEAHVDPATPDTPTTEVDTPAPEEGTLEVPQIDWEKRYKDLQSYADQRYQEAQDQLQTYEERLTTQEPQVVQPDLDDEDDWYDNPLEHPGIAAQLERLDRLEAQLTAQREQETLTRKQEVEEQFIDSQLDRIEAEYKDALTDEESSWIGNYALANRDAEGQPDVELAYVTYRKLLEGRKSQWVESKRSSAAPANGPGAVEVPEFETRQQRLDYINQRITAMEAGEDS